MAIALKTDFIPKNEGFTFPAEWSHHRATWLTLPLNDESWPGMMHDVYDVYFKFIRIITRSEQVAINVQNDTMAGFVRDMAERFRIDQEKIEIFINPSNDCWTRDHGPAFLKDDKGRKMVINWKFNAWGGKYPSDLDDQIALRIADTLNLPAITVDTVMEGGAVDFNGKGTVLTTKACLLNPNRNPHLSPEIIERQIRDYYGAEKICWLEDGIAGDDTDGHVDDIARFVNEETVVTMIESDRTDPNYEPLLLNRKILDEFRLPDGNPLNIIEIPMPPPVCFRDERLPASYANFYITNGHVVVPVFQADTDEKALEILSGCFPGREVVGIDSRVLIHGFGSFHCLSQQEPL